MRNTIKKEPVILPEELLSRERVVNLISNKVDTMKNQVTQMK